MPELLRETPSDSVVILRINRPDRMDALNTAVREALAVEINAISADDTTRCVVITGDDKAFAAGADVGELTLRKPLDPAFAASRIAWLALEKCPKPVIAAVNGFALGGGCELALHCDIIIAGENAKLGQPEVKLGIMPGAGGTQRILRAAGKFAAMRYLLTGDIIPAPLAFQLGIVSEVVPDAEVFPHALALAGKIAKLAPLAVAAIKESILLGADAPLSTALSLERKAFQLLFASEDRDEGMKAFAEKRKPQFKGR